jgi:thiol-disulfide isomerase/thioredoxin
LLALSTTCHFCSESAPFYQQLAKERGSNTRIVAVLPQSVSDSKDYLNNLGIFVDEVKQESLNTINVRGTPTLMLVNGDGVVVDEWMGRLSVEQEAEVLSKLEWRK